MRDSWLDDQTNPLDDPWAQPPPPTAPPQADPLATQASAPDVPSPTGDWSTADTAPASPQAGAGYAGDLGPQSVNPGQVQQAAAQGGVAGGSAAADVARYQSHLDAVHNATDPQSKAVAQDALARQLQQDMEADGHKVTWKGNVMMIDGRPYEIAGEGVQASTAGGPGGYGTMPGFETSRANNPSDTDPKTVFQRWAAGLGGHITGDDVRAFVASDPRWEINPASNPNDPQIRVKQDALNTWKPGESTWQEVIRDAGPGGANAAEFINAQGEGPGYAHDAMPASSQLTSWLDASHLRGGAGTTPSGVPGGPSWLDLYNMAAAPSSLDNQLDAFSSDLLAHPETLSDRDVETLKAKDAEEAATSAQLADEELQHLGYQTGQDSSPWLAGQRAQNQWDRRSATIASNRKVDIAAADRRMSDKQSAAKIASDWASLSHTKKQQALTTATDYLKASMGYDIDLKKLAESSDEFQRELVYRIDSLKQADDQFRSNYGLDVQKFDHTKDEDYWKRSQAAFAPPQ